MDRSTLAASRSAVHCNPLSPLATTAGQREKGEAETHQEEEEAADLEVIRGCSGRQHHALLRPEKHKQGKGKPYSLDSAVLIWNSTAG
jgi:hypothetical protein